MKQLRRWAGTALSVLVLAVVIWRVGTGPFVDGIKAVDARAVIAAAAIVLVTTLCSAWRWTVVARGLGIHLALPAAVASYYRALFLNLTLPSGVAGDVHRGVSHGRDVHDVGRALRAVVWERAAGQVVQVTLTMAVLLALPSPVRTFMLFVVTAAGAAVLGLVLAARLRPGGARTRWTRLRNTAAADIRGGVLRPDALPAILLTSVLVVAGHTMTFLIAARTVGVSVATARLLPLAMLALLAMVLPNIGGWGPREGVTAWVFSAAGLGASRGAAAAVTYGVLVLAASLPGAIVLLIGWLPRRRLARTEPDRIFSFRPGHVVRPEQATVRRP
jgi:uncharacterized membrane protein YbhN (UPF0104 family)